MKYILNGKEVTEAEWSQGGASRLQDMFESGITPTLRTDNTFLEGHANGSQFEKCTWAGDKYARIARKHGQDVKGKVYLSGLAAFPGDPEAWVSGRTDVQRVCEKRGWGCRGAVNVPLREPENPPEPIPIADDIVDRRVAQILMKVERPECVDVQDLREQVKEKIGPRK